MRLSLVVLFQFFLFCCVSFLLAGPAFALPANCSITLFASKAEAERFGEVEELCLIAGTSAFSAIEKNQLQICNCGADKVFIQQQKPSSAGSGTVNVVGFRYKAKKMETKATAASSGMPAESHESTAEQPSQASPAPSSAMPKEPGKPELAEESAPVKPAEPAADSVVSPEPPANDNPAINLPESGPALVEEPQMAKQATPPPSLPPSSPPQAASESQQMAKPQPKEAGPGVKMKSAMIDTGRFEEGMQFLQAGNNAKAVEIFKDLAAGGDLRAQFKLGLMYIKGQGVPQNYTEGAQWFRKVAEQGDAAAQFNLGTMYYLGNGVPQDYSEAAKWYRKAVEQGNGKAQINLGAMYSQGIGVGRDDVQALMWFNIASSILPPGGNFELAVDNRDILEDRMTTEQITEAQRLAQEWKPKAVMAK